AAHLASILRLDDQRQSTAAHNITWVQNLGAQSFRESRARRRKIGSDDSAAAIDFMASCAAGFTEQSLSICDITCRIPGGLLCLNGDCKHTGGGHENELLSFFHCELRSIRRPDHKPQKGTELTKILVD